MESVMEWESYVRKIGGSFYVRIPTDWARNKGIQRDDEIRVSLSLDGTLRIDKK
jgi:antitoxin component of MazEF toxin-antitoxin module